MTQTIYGILFEVEQAARIDYHLPVVLARILEPQPFSLDEDATLDGCRLVQVLEIPPAQRADGSPRLDLYAFALADVGELARFSPGAVVELRTAGPRRRRPAQGSSELGTSGSAGRLRRPAASLSRSSSLRGSPVV